MVKAGYKIFKRIFDIIFSLLVLIILSPFLLIIALIIYIDDPHGSPIFTQTRIGKDGKAFKFYKFRSMYSDAEKKLSDLLSKNEVDGHAFKIKNDPRITRVGKFIRKTSIDEFPQFFNVLIGNMSIVGPRPPLKREYIKYNEKERKRLSVTPGLTCLWQIQENRNSIPFNEWVDLDLEYINNRSIILDLKIIIKTIGAVINGHGQ